MLPMRDVRTDGRTREDRATQPMDAGWLSFAIWMSQRVASMVFPASKAASHYYDCNIIHHQQPLPLPHYSTTAAATTRFPPDRGRDRHISLDLNVSRLISKSKVWYSLCGSLSLLRLQHNSPAAAATTRFPPDWRQTHLFPQTLAATQSTIQFQILKSEKMAPSTKHTCFCSVYISCIGKNTTNQSINQSIMHYFKFKKELTFLLFKYYLKYLISSWIADSNSFYWQSAVVL